MNNVGLFDLSSMAKLLVQGLGALLTLNRMSTAQMDVPIGRLVYTQWLNPRGGIVADVTVTRLAQDQFMIVTATASQVRDADWLRTQLRRIQEEHGLYSSLTDITSGLPMMAIMGPKSRALLSDLCGGADLGSTAFPFGTSQILEIGYAQVRAARISYVGELGWEIYIPIEFAHHVIERVLEAGLAFTCAWDKAGGFIGREAALAKKEQCTHCKRMVQFKLNNDAEMLYREEPLFADGQHVGVITSGMYGHRVQAPLGMGYVKCDHPISAEWLASSSTFEIGIANRRVTAEAQLAAWYDTKSERMKV